MLIFGRSPNLILGALTAIFNVLTVFHVGGFDPTVEQISVVNVALGAIVALIANSDNIMVAAGKAAAIRQNGSGGGQ
jgi:hypothetical protein